MFAMPTEYLRLRRCPDGYYRTSWVDDHGERHGRSFGRGARGAERQFHDFHARWQADPTVRNPSHEGPLTVQRAWELFAEHAEQHYRHGDGTPTGEHANLELAFRPALEMFGGQWVDRFGPRALKAVRERMIDAELCVAEINKRIRKIRQVFKWLASEEYAPATVWHGLQTVEALQAGRSRARVSEPVTSVPDAHVWAVSKHVPATVRAMIELQYLTGMRPGEVCRMRAVDVDTAGKVWVFRPTQHKTAHHQKERLILLGPRAQQIVRQFMRREVAAYLFSPLEARRQRCAQCKTHRHQPNAEPRTERRVGTRYTPSSYAQVIARACREHSIPAWSPNRLRHNAATRLRKEFGLDVAQVVLGHSSADVTQVYAAVDMERAVAAMERVG